ncbi:MAG TPA: T9SS type A sorting domain-containing protein [bacterium]
MGHYRTVTAKDVWPGIDVQYRIHINMNMNANSVGAHSSVPVGVPVGAPVGIETVYHLHPGADPNQIQLRYEGQDTPIAVDANGSLLLSTSLGTVKEQAPFAYQNINHTQTEIPCRYELTAEDGYQFVLGPYDATNEVVIDPELIYSTFWGTGGFDNPGVVTLDSAECPIVAGSTESHNFPTTPGVYEDHWVGQNGFVTKFSPGGDSLRFSTYCGGAFKVTLSLDTDQSLVLVGSEVWNNWPVTANGFDTTLGGNSDIGLAALSADGGQLLWGSYWGGSSREDNAVSSLGPDGILYITALSQSQDFPLTENALYTTPHGSDASILAAFDLHQMQVLFSSYFPVNYPIPFAQPGGAVWLCGQSDSSGLPVTPDALFPGFVAQTPPFFARLRMRPPTVEYASYFGNQIPRSGDQVYQVQALDSSHVLLAGVSWAAAPGFAMPSGGYQSAPDSQFDAFVIEVALPSTLIAGTFLGGSGMEGGPSIAAAADRSVLITGCTRSANFPLSPDAYQRTYHPGEYEAALDLYVARLSADLSTLLYSTYLSGSNGDEPCYEQSIALHDLRHVWFAGATWSPDFPTTPNALMPGPREGDYTWLACFDLHDSADAAPPSFILPPSSFSLSCFPNPFNPTTTLSFTLPASSEVTLEVFDVLGRSVYQQNLGRMTAGEHQHRFDATTLSSGIYFAKLQSGESSQIRKLVLLR